MTQNQAIQIVVRAAEANSNGHEHCQNILQACEIVRAINQPGAPVASPVDYWCRDCQDWFMAEHQPEPHALAPKCSKCGGGQTYCCDREDDAWAEPK